MNLVGKLFTLFIALMAIVCGSVAGAYSWWHKRDPNWPAVVKQRTEELSAAERTLNDTREENDTVNQQLKDERERQQRAIVKLELENRALAAERQKKVDARLGAADKSREQREKDKEISERRLVDLLEDLDNLTKAKDENKKDEDGMIVVRTRRAITEREGVKATLADRVNHMGKLQVKTDEFNSAVEEFLRLQIRAELLKKELGSGGL